MTLRTAVGRVRPRRYEQRDVIIASRIVHFESDWNNGQESSGGGIAPGGEIIGNSVFEPVASLDEFFAREQGRVDAAVLVRDGRAKQFAVAIEGHAHARGGNTRGEIENVCGEL